MVKFKIKDNYNLNLITLSISILLISILFILPLAPQSLHYFLWAVVVLINTFIIIKYLYIDKIKNKSLKIDVLDISIFLFFIWQILIFIYHKEGFISLLKLYACVSTMLVLKNIELKKVHFSIIKYIAMIFIISWILNKIGKPIGEGYQAYFRNPNLLGIYSVNVFVLLWISKFNIKIIKILLLFASIYILLITKARTSYLQLMIIIFLFCIIYIYENYIFKYKNNYKNYLKIIFIIITTSVILFSILYPSIHNTEFGDIIDEISITLFDKSFFTGRNLIWKSTWDLILKGPIFGHGLNADIRNILNMELSTHNLYLSVILQQGFIGFILLINILYQSFKMIITRNKKTTNIIAVVIISAIVRETFEITLTHNILVAGIFIWFIIGLGLNKKDNFNIES